MRQLSCALAQYPVDHFECCAAFVFINNKSILFTSKGFMCALDIVVYGKLMVCLCLMSNINTHTHTFDFTAFLLLKIYNECRSGFGIHTHFKLSLHQKLNSLAAYCVMR